MSELKRKTPLARSTKPIARSAPKRKPAKARKPRVQSTNNFHETVKAEVRRRSANICEICHAAKAVAFHHRKLRRHGDSRACNCLHLCNHCHIGVVHANPGKSYLMGWLVRSTLDPADVPVKAADARRPARA